MFDIRKENWVGFWPIPIIIDDLEKCSRSHTISFKKTTKFPHE